MKMVDLLGRDRIRVPLRAESLESGVRILAGLLPAAGPSHDLQATDPGPPDHAGRDLLARLRDGEGGTVHPVSPRTIVLALRGGERTSAALGVAREPLVSGEGESARAILVLQSGPGSRIRAPAIDRVIATLRQPEVESALLTADSPEAVLRIQGLMTVPLTGKMRVADYLTPLSYRIYPDTPIVEVADLMARKNVATVPVVGEGLQVLGMISSGEALRQALQGRGVGGESMAGVLAKDVMSRSVLCVTEDQDLLDAGKMMANRDLAQLPVVREGEMVGFLTREAVLRALLSESG